MEQNASPRAQKRFSVYKPNKKLSGLAIQFDFNPARESVFVEAAPQKGEQEFDWGSKLVMKLSDAEIAKLVSFLEGKTKSLDLYHDMSKAKTLSEDNRTKNTTLNAVKGDYGFFLKISQQNTDGSVRAVNVPLGDDEGVALRLLLEQALKKIYGW